MIFVQRPPLPDVELFEINDMGQIVLTENSGTFLYTGMFHV